MSGRPFVPRATTVDEMQAVYAQRAAHTSTVFDAVMRGSEADMAWIIQSPDPNANETRDELLVRVRRGQDNSTWRPATEADFGIEPASTDEKKNPQPVCEEGIPPAAPQISTAATRQTDEPSNADDSASDGDEDDVLFLPRHDDQLSCTESSCYACAQRACPHHEPLHYHHDGCPACWNEEQHQQATKQRAEEGIVPTAANDSVQPIAVAQPLSAVALYPRTERVIIANSHDDLCCPDCYMTANNVKSSQ